MKEKFNTEQREELNSIAMRASDLHKSVNQMYGDKPYSYHLFKVAEVMDKYVEEDIDYELYKILYFACMFHDSIEDARLTYNDVSKIALKYMSLESAYLATEIVYSLTNEKGRTREERANSKYYEGIRNTLHAPFIKACDRLANMTNAQETGDGMYKKYLKELPNFLNHIASESNPVPKDLVQELLNLS